jgi:hypothetical protein
MSQQSLSSLMAAIAAANRLAQVKREQAAKIIKAATKTA